MDQHCAEYWNIDLNRASALPRDRAFLGPTQEETLARLLFAMESGLRGAELCGLAGTGKSLLFDLVERYCSPASIWIARIDLAGCDRSDTLSALAQVLGLALPGGLAAGSLWRSIADRIAGLNLAGRRVLVIADHLDEAAPEAYTDLLRLLRTASASLTLIMARRSLEPSSGVALDRAISELSEMRVVLRPLTRADLAGYLTARWPVRQSGCQLFSTTAVDALFEATRGIPRQVDRLSELCLLETFVAEERVIDDTVVAAAIEAAGWTRPADSPRVFESFPLARAS